LNTFARIENLSPIRRERWLTVPVPTAAVDEFPTELVAHVNEHRQWRAVKGRQHGRGTLVHICADIDGHESVRVEILPRVMPAESDSSFEFHPWVSDDFSKLVPQFGARVDGVDLWSTPAHTELVEQNEARQRWRHVEVLAFAGLVLEWWADIYSRDNVVDVWGKLTWSDRRDSNWNRSFEALWIRTGEFVRFDYETTHGIVNGASKDSTGKFVALLGTNVSLNDGASLPLSGSMLCFKDDELDPDDIDAAVRNMQAAERGPVLGCSEAWSGEFLACGHLARINQQAKQEIELEWRQFEDDLENHRGWFAPRPIGITRTPGQTGNQEDFGVTKGTAVTVMHHARHIYRMRWGVQGDYFRGLSLLEDTFRPLQRENHPNWVTWSGITHYHTGVSSDRLGKEPPRTPGTGWHGYDNQHRSQNNLAAYLQLCDDPATASLVAGHIEIDKADYRSRYPQNGAGAPRAIGRTAAAWANLSTVMPAHRADLEELMHANVVRARNQRDHIAGAGPMKPLGILGPDGRYPVRLEEGGPIVQAVSVWEHGLAIVGLWMAKQVMPSSAWLEDLLTTTAELLARYGLIEDSVGFHLVNGVAWNNGEDPPGGMVVGSPALMPGTGGVGGWTTAGLLVAREVLPQSHPDWDKVDRYVRAAIEPETSSVYWAEWYAAAGDPNQP